MNISDIFSSVSEKATSRFAAYAFAAVTVLGLEGCATVSSNQNVMRGAATSIINHQSYQLRKGMADSMSHATKCAIGIRNCGQNSSQYDQLGTQRRADPRYGY